MNYIALAIPVFFLLIGVELVFTRLLERDTYRLSDSVGDLSCGLLQQVTEVFLKTSVFAAYVFVYESWRQFEVPASASWAWASCYLGYDLLYYWYHRLSHEVNAGWASHVVHHQSEEYNLTVALRQSAIPVSWVFYLPLALVGFPPQMFLVVSTIDTLYQFWIHTRLVGRLGPLEWVLNTPSHHRVHHGRNPRYIDRNHGGTLIVWDRLFGTFAEEREEPVYGITKPLASFNPLWANLHYWVEMWDVARRTARPLDRLRVLWARPGWRPADLGGPLQPPEVDRSSYVKFDVPARGLPQPLRARAARAGAARGDTLPAPERQPRRPGARAGSRAHRVERGELRGTPRRAALGRSARERPARRSRARRGARAGTGARAWRARAARVRVGRLAEPGAAKDPSSRSGAALGSRSFGVVWSVHSQGRGPVMVTVCAWCQKYMGSMEPLNEPRISHGLCGDCIERESLDGAPVLVVSPGRARAIPVLKSLLRGAPEIAIVIDRRARDRRGEPGREADHGRPVAYVVERRETDRRRAPSLYLV